MQKNDIWIIMDRDTQADDNGEHFYRYMKRAHPEKEAYFVLRKSSPDWKRLNAEGFNLLDFGSTRHERMLERCSKIISSHADGYVHSYFDDNFYGSKDFIFLQHGVIKDDLSLWLNDKPISLLITSTEPEFDSITSDESPYLFTKKEVALTGMPRHDALLCSDIPTENMILIMPTWRKDLMGSQTGKGNGRRINPDFSKSAYCKNWEKVLACDSLKELHKEGYSIVFFPHTNIEPYVHGKQFRIPSWVDHRFNDGLSSIQTLFKKACLLITDYSSTAFEMAYLEKPCIYYQFDADDFFSGSHVYKAGYFDYKQDGFGPVANSIQDLEAALDHLHGRSFKPEEPYLQRMKTQFAYRDGKCCKRVYERIESIAK